jgi:hypothetical protein
MIELCWGIHDEAFQPLSQFDKMKQAAIIEP